MVQFFYFELRVGGREEEGERQGEKNIHHDHSLSSLFSSLHGLGSPPVSETIVCYLISYPEMLHYCTSLLTSELVTETNSGKAILLHYFKMVDMSSIILFSKLKMFKTFALCFHYLFFCSSKKFHFRLYNFFLDNIHVSLLHNVFDTTNLL